jgi:hypothetical protein
MGIFFAPSGCGATGRAQLTGTGAARAVKACSCTKVPVGLLLSGLGAPFANKIPFGLDPEAIRRLHQQPYRFPREARARHVKPHSYI